ncbi:MAG TPA: c-type cytochrome biogenesis protein CcmI [Rhodospirillales bacterium]|nr:c-type cytochrome biogenesis protein CcmI [Rhodospirillales bacterium]HJO69668.1 c-type cytochrome biogenesis protein CcmI [Rhodospirillales bacterium]
MIAFWAIVTLMSAVVAAALVIPLLGKARSARDRREYDLAVYRDQLGEVDRDVARGVLADDQARATRTEIERRILAAAEDESPSGGDVPRPAAGLAPAQSTWALALTVAVLIPAGGFALYLYLGAPELPDAPFAGRSEALEQAAQSRSEMGGLLADLAERLRQAPDDLDGWALLARSYRSMDRPRESADAFARAVELSERAPSYLSAYGEMLVAAARGQVTPEGRQAFEEALAKEPGDSRARYYIGVAKEQAGDKAGALADWQALVARADASAPWLEEISRQMARVAAELRVEIVIAAPVLRGPSAADVEAVSEMTPEERQTMIRTMVEGLAERLAQQPDDVEGWLMLARSYATLGEDEKAREARARADALMRERNENPPNRVGAGAR